MDEAAYWPDRHFDRRPWIDFADTWRRQVVALFTPDDVEAIGFAGGVEYDCSAYVVGLQDLRPRYRVMRGLGRLTSDEAARRIHERRSECRARYSAAWRRYRDTDNEYVRRFGCEYVTPLTWVFHDPEATYWSHDNCRAFQGSRIILWADDPTKRDFESLRIAASFGHPTAPREYVEAMLDEYTRAEQGSGGLPRWIDRSFYVYLNALRAADLNETDARLVEAAGVRLSSNCRRLADDVFSKLGPVWGEEREDRDVVHAAFLAARECLPEFRTPPDGRTVSDAELNDSPEQIVANITEYRPLCGDNNIVEAMFRTPDPANRTWVD